MNHNKDIGIEKVFLPYSGPPILHALTLCMYVGLVIYYFIKCLHSCDHYVSQDAEQFHHKDPTYCSRSHSHPCLLLPQPLTTMNLFLSFLLLLKNADKLESYSM